MNRSTVGQRVLAAPTDHDAGTVAEPHFRDFFKRYYGPTIAAYRNLADDPARTAALDRALTEVAREAGADSGTMQWEYLLVTAQRAE